jgi:heme A synthase
LKYSLEASFSRWVFGLFVAVLALTVLGRAVAVTGAIAYCGGFLFCIPTQPLGWLKIAHILSVGIASFLMLIVFRKAWKEQHSHLVLLPLTTILAVMFFGQAVVGAM